MVEFWFKFYWNLYGANQQQPSIDSENDLAQNTYHVIMWTNDDLVHWHIYGLLGFDDLTPSSVKIYMQKMMICAKVSLWKKSRGAHMCTPRNKYTVNVLMCFVIRYQSIYPYPSVRASTRIFARGCRDISRGCTRRKKVKGQSKNIMGGKIPAHADRYRADGCVGRRQLTETLIQGYFTDTGAILRLPQCLWSNPEEYR